MSKYRTDITLNHDEPLVNGDVYQLTITKLDEDDNKLAEEEPEQDQENKSIFDGATVAAIISGLLGEKNE